MAQSILDVHGIGPASQLTLAKNGFKTIKDLASTTVEKLVLTPGFSELRATQVISDAKDLIAVDAPKKKAKKIKVKAKKMPKDSKKDKEKPKKNKKKDDGKKKKKAKKKK